MMGARKLIKQYLAMTMLGLTCLLTMLPANAATTTIVVNADGTATRECTGFLFFQSCNDVYAAFDLYVQGVKVGATQTTTGSYQNFTFNSVTVPSTGTFNVDVHFINDYSCNSPSLLGLSSCSGDRNIGINSVTVGSDTITPAGETIDAGNSYAQATDGITTYAYSVGLYENSALRLSASPQAGFLLPAAIFLMVILAGLGAYALNISSVQNNAAIQDVQSTRAYHAARAGLEWAAHQIIQPSLSPSLTNCPGAQTLSLDGFNVTVNCTASSNYLEQGGGNTIRIYSVESTASFGTVNTKNYIERRIDMTLSKCIQDIGGGVSLLCQ